MLWRPLCGIPPECFMSTWKQTDLYKFGINDSTLLIVLFPSSLPVTMPNYGWTGMTDFYLLFSCGLQPPTPLCQGSTPHELHHGRSGLKIVLSFNVLHVGIQFMEHEAEMEGNSPAWFILEMYSEYNSLFISLCVRPARQGRVCSLLVWMI